MGKIKERHLKVVAKKLLALRPDLFSKDFDENKARLNEINLVKGGKHDRNRLAGRLSGLKKIQDAATERATQAALQKQQMLAAQAAQTSAVEQRS